MKSQRSSFDNNRGFQGRRQSVITGDWKIICYNWQKLKHAAAFCPQQISIDQRVLVVTTSSDIATKSEIKTIKRDTFWATIQYSTTCRVDIIKILV